MLLKLQKQKEKTIQKLKQETTEKRRDMEKLFEIQTFDRFQFNFKTKGLYFVG